MAKPSKPKMKQVNARFFTEDVDFLKQQAATEGMTEWHAKLRQALRLGVAELKRKKVLQ